MGDWWWRSKGRASDPEARALIGPVDDVTAANTHGTVM